jgi:hypothetical protein
MLSLLLEVSRYFSTADGPTTAQESILHAGFVWYLVGLTQPGHAVPRAQHSLPTTGRASPGHRVVALEGDGMPNPTPTRAGLTLVSASPGAVLPGEGMSCSSHAVVSDVARLEGRQ